MSEEFQINNDLILVTGASRSASAVMALIMGYALFVSSRTLHQTRQSVHLQCFTMNLIIALLSIVILLRDYVRLPCLGFAAVFYIIHIVSNTFSGFIIITKAYYASNMAPWFLYFMYGLQCLLVGFHIVAVSMVHIQSEVLDFQCTSAFERISTTLFVACDLLFNCLVSWQFLINIMRAHRARQSSLFVILFLDGAFFWIATTLVRVIAGLAEFIEFINTYLTTFLVLS
ncbi:hypothetical protein H4R33_006183, partial [Dimargaris cristalligena]